MTSLAAPTTFANAPCEWVAMFDGEVRTSSPLPLMGDIVHLRIRETDMALGPPSISHTSSKCVTRRYLHLVVLTGAKDDILDNRWSVTGFLCRGFTYATVPNDHVSNMDAACYNKLLPLPSVLAPQSPTPAEFGSPLRTDNFATPRHTWLWAKEITFDMGREPVYYPSVSPRFLC